VGECKEMRLADIDTEECNEWWGLEDLRESSSSLYAFLRMGSSDDAETGTTQTVANQIGSVLRLAAVNGSHIRLCKFQPLFYFSSMYVFYGWILIIIRVLSCLVLFF